MGGNWNEVEIIVPEREGWTSEIAINEPAGTDRRMGNFVAYHVGPTPKDLAIASPVMLTVVQGINCNSGDCVVHNTDQYMISLFGDFGDLQITDRHPLIVPPLTQIASLYSRHGGGTERTIVTTYSGKDLDQTPFKIRAYVAGGVTSSVAFIYYAPEEVFEAHAEDVEIWIYEMFVKHTQYPLE